MGKTNLIPTAVKLDPVTLETRGRYTFGGGLNACGCHFNRKTGECHCHRPQNCGCACEQP